MPWREAVALIAQIADAVGHAHSKGIVHRDLKPANILLSEDNKPVVADFGLALGDDEHSYRSSVCGTYQYMSPQQVGGQADRVDGRAVSQPGAARWSRAATAERIEMILINIRARQ